MTAQKKEMKEVVVYELISMDGFDFGRYYEGEREILTPRLIAAGYSVLNQFYTIDGDDFGPLVRGVKLRSPSGEEFVAFYG